MTRSRSLSQTSLFESARVEEFDLPGAEIVLHRGIWDRTEGDFLCEQLIDELEWRQDKISMFGRVHDVPRLNAWYGDPDCSYSWSGIQMHPTEWTSNLRRIQHAGMRISGLRIFGGML